MSDALKQARDYTYAERINNRLEPDTGGTPRADCVVIAAEADAEIESLRRQFANAKIGGPLNPMDEALDAGDGTLHGAIAYWHGQAEHFEREWYLRGDQIESLAATAKALVAAPQPAAPQSDPYAPPEIQEAIKRGEFEPGQWTVSAQRAIEKNPSGALRIIARLRDEVASLKAAPAPAQAVPPTMPPAYMLAKLQMVMPLFQESRDALTAITEQQRKLHGISPTLAERMDEAGTFSLDDWQRAHGIKQPGSDQ